MQGGGRGSDVVADGGGVQGAGSSQLEQKRPWRRGCGEAGGRAGGVQGAGSTRLERKQHCREGSGERGE
eukprot:1508232-Rhodomonas_salina.1